MWHALFGVAAAVAAALVVAGAPAERRPAALLLIGVTAAWYGLTGARVLDVDQGTPRAWAYVLVAAPAAVALFALYPAAGGVLLFLVFPQLWRVLPTAAAVVGTVLISAAMAAALLAHNAADAAPLVVGGMALALVGALLLGLWITRIAAQSERRAALLAELHATRAELAAANRDIGALAERERLARDIHDTLAQGFTSILLLSRALDDERIPQGVRRERLATLRATAQENLDESRALVASLAPLGAGTLPAALRRLTERVGAELGVAAAMRVEGAERVLPAAHDVVLLRVSQEALANVRKHAGATRVDLVLTQDDGGTELRISDDGCGFEPNVPERGFGLAGIRDRVREVGGTVEVRSAAGRGTDVVVRLP